MDVRSWGLGQIMQLPDCCFGRRFSVCCDALSVEEALAWDISEVALPEKCVLWEVVINSDVSVVAPQIASVRIALGDQLPASSAMMDALEPLVPGLGIQGPEPRYISGLTNHLVFHTRYPISVNGRRLILEVISNAGVSARIQLVCEFSSIPTEVPDCLFSR